LAGMGFEFWWEEIFSSPDMSRPALSPTHLPVHWVPGFFLGVKAAGA